MKKFYFASFKSLKKRVGSVINRYGMDPHQNATDPQHCSSLYKYESFERSKNLWGFLTPPVEGALFLAALVASCFLGALPPVDLRAVCLVRAIFQY